MDEINYVNRMKRNKEDEDGRIEKLQYVKDFEDSHVQIRERSLTEFLDMFPNGEKRFLNSAIFNRTIQCLAAGVDPLTIIDGLLAVIEEQFKPLVSRLEEMSRPVSIILKDRMSEEDVNTVPLSNQNKE